MRPTRHDCDGNCRACWDDGYERGKDAMVSALSDHIAKLQAEIYSLHCQIAQLREQQS